MKRLCYLMAVIMMLTLAGCVNTQHENPVEPTPSPVQTASPTPDAATPEPSKEVVTETAMAIYGGRADLNFIEIIINDKYVSAKLSTELKGRFDELGLKENDKIKVEYTVKNGLYEVYEISKN